MNEDPEFKAFAALIAQVFAISPEEVTRTTTAGEIDGWDSISHATVIMSIETAYRISFDDADIYDPADVGELYDRTKKLIVERPA